MKTCKHMLKAAEYNTPNSQVRNATTYIPASSTHKHKPKDKMTQTDETNTQVSQCNYTDRLFLDSDAMLKFSKAMVENYEQNIVETYILRNQ